MSEAATVQATRAKLSNGPVRLFRNNTGALQNKDGTWVRYGLCTGSSDLIGWRTLTVTTDMVGSKLAVFVALEGKAKTGAATNEQTAFIAAVKDAGGIAGVFRSVDEAAQLLGVK
jgi:VRR-NUC domain